MQDGSFWVLGIEWPAFRQSAALGFEGSRAKGMSLCLGGLCPSTPLLRLDGANTGSTWDIFDVDLELRPRNPLPGLAGRVRLHAGASKKLVQCV